ncbi:response regulator transcription factor [Mesorhizobium sp. DCY119]|uniref:response regulator transcription factor n=1 Tax=Mesorhizobium sp. DCY119 TaxID=2108445 RepID=UPI000E7611D0|nr:response regulator transcription factor [Mesorhizobium sp. DCY119]RJG40944.1 DNA-binding response regulator [Mesorhizobium sp. DCY119]
MKPLIFVCTQDAWSYLVFSHILKADGFEVELAQDAEDLISLAEEKPGAAVLLDCHADVQDAPEICRRLKNEAGTGEIPVIASIPGGGGNQHMELLKAGVAQSFVRPFDPEQLLNYLRTALRPRGEPGASVPEAESDIFSVGKLELFPRKHRVQYDGKEFPLRQLEFRLLCVLILEPCRVFARDELIQMAWPENINVEPRTVDVHIGRLRHALKKAAGKDMIRTVRSAGYALEAKGI